MKRVGYFYSAAHPEYEMPITHLDGWVGQQHWIRSLRELQMSLQGMWLRHRVDQGPATDLITVRDEVVKCLICADSERQDMDYRLTNPIGSFQWPSMYSHYLAIHNVRPDPEFKAAVDYWEKENARHDPFGSESDV